ncbi:MAG: hypothetical protein NVSMB7_04940 [Chitinophagaceae bacterium]
MEPGLSALIRNAGLNKKTALAKTREWWRRFWNRSYIFIEGKDSFISRNYQLFRYQLGCNAFGKWPTKFNAGLFTFDPVYVDKKQAWSPDFRVWGGGTMMAPALAWARVQNTETPQLYPRASFSIFLGTGLRLDTRSQLGWVCYDWFAGNVDAGRWQQNIPAARLARAMEWKI